MQKTTLRNEPGFLSPSLETPCSGMYLCTVHGSIYPCIHVSMYGKYGSALGHPHGHGKVMVLVMILVMVPNQLCCSGTPYILVYSTVPGVSEVLGFTCIA